MILQPWKGLLREDDPQEETGGRGCTGGPRKVSEFQLSGIFL